MASVSDGDTSADEANTYSKTVGSVSEADADSYLDGEGTDAGSPTAGKDDETYERSENRSGSSTSASGSEYDSDDSSLLPLGNRYNCVGGAAVLDSVMSLL